MTAGVTDFATLMDLEPHGPDVFVAASVPTPWGRVYGGQVIAQGLWAAAQTVDPDYTAHSLHAYFIRGGDLGEPIRYEVDRIRNGRSFVTRRVVARQSSGAILNLSASFQTVEERADVPVAAPAADLPGPADVPSTSWSPLHDRRVVRRDRENGRMLAWQRVPGVPDGDQVLAACALAFASDDVPMGAARSTHPSSAPENVPDDVVMSASLDHSLWFHRPAPASSWLLYDLSAQGWSGGRGLSWGHVFTPDGRQVASIAQQVLVRERLDDAVVG